MSRIRKWFGNLCQAAEEIYRYVVLGLVLRAAALILPKSWATTVAKFMGFLLALSPHTGKHAYWDFRSAFGAQRWRSFRLAHAWLSRPFVDHVALLRICHNREEKDEWNIIEHNAGPVRLLMESGKPLIVATGHFAREGFWCLYLERVLPAFVLGVIGLMPTERTLYGRRMRIQFGTIIGSWDHVRPVNREWIIVGGGASAMQMLIDGLHQSGRVVVIAIDAPWQGGKPGTFARPFAGHRSRIFATGTARLARLTQANLLSCVLWIDNDRRVVIEWGTPILPPEEWNEAADISIMNRLLDPLEVAIGKRPTQYVLTCGADRQWNPAVQEWEDQQKRE